MKLIAPGAFVISSLVIFWVPWDTLVKTIPIVAVGLVLYGLNYFRDRSSVGDTRAGIWLVVYLAALYVLSAVGTFGGAELIPAPWDSVVVAVVALAVYWWGVRSAVDHMASDPERTEALRAEARADSTVDDLSPATAS